jgi:glucose-6-phosphate dehydrogenase assembly protein OpcA
VIAEDVWAERDTTPDAIDNALREMLRQRHAANEALAPARVLNLVVIVDRDWKGEIANRLQRVGRYHASRTVLCTVEPGREKLDARVVMSYDEPRDGLGVIHETVEVDLGPVHLARLETIVDPIVVAELPTMLWSPHGHDEAVRRLLGLVDVVLLDSDDIRDCGEALPHADDLLCSAYVVDLAWLRTTPWRERLAATFEPPDRRAALPQISEIAIRHHPSSDASAMLLVGWLCSRLGWHAEPLESLSGGGLHGVAGGVGVELAPLSQKTPGLAGVTITCGGILSISLDRAPGGLHARERDARGNERVWQVLGASRGEGGILGEGVRQALLRDPTYGPALGAARELCPA